MMDRLSPFFVVVLSVLFLVTFVHGRSEHRRADAAAAKAGTAEARIAEMIPKPPPSAPVGENDVLPVLWRGAWYTPAQVTLIAGVPIVCSLAPEGVLPARTAGRRVDLGTRYVLDVSAITVRCWRAP